MRPYVLSETNFHHVKDCEYQVAVLPMGATEPHNLHLPYGTDTFQAEAISERACEAAWNNGAKVVMLPAIPYGTETNHNGFPLAMNINPSTMTLVVGDLLESLIDHKINKLVILNSHGGNEFKPLLREMTGTTPVQMFLCDWFRKISADVQAEIFDDPGDHAGEMETALGLAFFPEFVALNDDGKITGDDGAMASTRFDAVNEGWVSISRPWHLLTKNTGAGDPHPATAEKGEKLMAVLVERLSDFLKDLSDSPVDETFPF